MRILRVFPRRTSLTPQDDYAFIGDPPLFRPDADEVHVSCCFTWDKPEAERLAHAWAGYYENVTLGGPAYDDPGAGFTPGLYVRHGVTITSRGCPRRCWFCSVPRREGPLHTLPIHPGHIVQDNNLLACPRPHIEAVCDMLETQRSVAFTGGLDARCLQSWHVDRFRRISLKSNGALFFALDDPSSAAWRALDRATELLGDFSRQVKRCYVLIGYPGDTSDAADTRLRRVWQCGFMPFAQFYRGDGEGERTPGWAALQRTWSRPAAMVTLMRLAHAKHT